MANRGKSEQRDIERFLWEKRANSLDEAVKIIEDADRRLKGMCGTALSLDDRREALFSLLSASPLEKAVETLSLRTSHSRKQ